MDLSLLKELCFKVGVSGAESNIREFILDKMQDFTPYIDDCGNVVCVKKSKEKNAPTLLIDAHMDSVGLCVREVCDRGFLKICGVGGVDERILPASMVVVHGKKDVFGVISTKPPHLMDKKDEDAPVNMENLFVDTGDDAEGISVGDRISYMPNFSKLLHGVSAPYLDNRLGCLAVIELFNALKDIDLPFNLKGVFSSGEESGMKGAKFTHETSDMGIVLDVTFAKTPDETSDEALKVSGGTAIGVGPNLHKEISGGIKDVACKKGIKYQLEVLEGCSGTNAWMYQVAGLGMPVGMISFPIKYMHTPVETVNFDDYESSFELLKEYILSLTAEKIREISEVTVC